MTPQEKARNIAGELVDLAQALMDLGYNIQIRIQGVEINLERDAEGDNPDANSGLSEA